MRSTIRPAAAVLLAGFALAAAATPAHAASPRLGIFHRDVAGDDRPERVVIVNLTRDDGAIAVFRRVYSPDDRLIRSEQTLLPPPADLTGDGVVDSADIERLVADLGQRGGTGLRPVREPMSDTAAEPSRRPLPTDLNRDGVVDGDDLRIALGRVGQPAPMSQCYPCLVTPKGDCSCGDGDDDPNDPDNPGDDPDGNQSVPGDGDGGGSGGGGGESDDDDDGVDNDDDNCPNTPNPDQNDSDGDGTGDACDPNPDDPDDTFDLVSQTIATVPDNVERTTIGINEQVLIETDPETSATWTVEPEEHGSIGLDPEQESPSSVFTAAAIPGMITITATAEDGESDSITFNIIEPNEIWYGTDFADADPYPLPLGNEVIGNGRVFLVQLRPTTVSFRFAEFRENFPPIQVNWPDGSLSNFPGDVVPFTVSPAAGAPNIAQDTVKVSPIAIEALSDPGQGPVNFEFSVPVPLEYKRENDQLGWITFVDEQDNRHIRVYKATGECALRVIGVNTRQSAFRGPWQAP